MDRKEKLRKETEPFLKFLADRFRTKIDPKEYALSYSGGKDSHFLYWFIKSYLKDEQIEIVGVNTQMEHPEIRDRIYANCDTILLPEMSKADIKEKFGIPCFTKNQDEFIDRYQRGSRTENTMNRILGINTTKYALNTKARKLLVSGELHKVSRKCCIYTKEKPMQHYLKEKRKKPILGVRKSEGVLRSSSYQSCMQKSGAFTPIYDFSDQLMEAIYIGYEIEIPCVYNYISRTGCIGCPYGNCTETELGLVSENQRKFAVNYFKESYDVLGVNYKYQQLSFLNYE